MSLLALVAGLALSAASLAAGHRSSAGWARPAIEIVTEKGLMGGDPDAFRPDDPITQGELAGLVQGVTGRTFAPASPQATVTIANLDSRFVRSVGLTAAAKRFDAGARAAGLTPPSRFGTEAVARLLGFRINHTGADEPLELGPGEPATRAEAAYTAARILLWKGWEKQYADDLSRTFVLPELGEWQRAIVQESVSLVGYPYVWGGASERPQVAVGVQAPGGFDCSGLAWRVFRAAQYASGTLLASTLRGRTTYAMSSEVPAARRVAAGAIEPADLLFFGPAGPRSTARSIDHAGVYLGGGWMIDASSTGVSVAPVATGYWQARLAWARRPLAEAGLA